MRTKRLADYRAVRSYFFQRSLVEVAPLMGQRLALSVARLYWRNAGVLAAMHGRIMGS